MKAKATAVLKVTSKAQVTKELVGFRLHGYIYNDSRNKFEDGAFVTTSPVRDVIIELGRETIAVTRSGSAYTIQYMTDDELIEKAALEAELEGK